MAEDGVEDPEKMPPIFSLTPLDHIQPRGYIRAILCFPLRSPSSSSYIDPSIVEGLNHGLTRTFRTWPLFGGSVALMGDGGETNGRLEVTGCVEPRGLVVKELSPREFPFSWADLEAAGMPLEPLDESLLSPIIPVPDTTKPAPAVLIQANFISGGLLLSISIHHGITDGKGAYLFSSALAAACCSGDYPAPAPGTGYFDDRTEVFRKVVGKAPASHSVYQNIKVLAADDTHVKNGSNGVNGVNGINGSNSMTATSSNEVTSRLFTFKTSSLAELKKATTSNLASCDGWVSTNDCLAALLWTSVVRARAPNLPPTSHTSSIALAIDIRARFLPPLARNYAGAAVLHHLATEQLSDLAPPSSSSPAQLAQVALGIRKSLRTVDRKYISDTVLFSESFEDIRDFGFKISHVHGADLILTSWADFPYYDLDFGPLGCPQWVRKPWSRHAAVIVVLPKTKLRDTLEVILMLREDEMERLEGDPAFMRWVDRVVA